MSVDKVTEIKALAGGATGTTAWTVTPVLNDTTLYYWRASATDVHGAKSVSAVGNFLVDTTKPAPGAPTLVGPAAGSTLTSASVAITVGNSLRPTGMSVNYYFEIDRAMDFSSADIVRSGPQPETATSTRFTLTGLVENAHYYWRVKVSDGLTDSPWTYGSFFVDTVNDPPSVPGALNPGDNAWITTLQPLFVVAPSIDPEGDTIAYHIQVYSDVALTTLVGERLTNTVDWLIATPLLDNTRYYWRVRAEDLRGGASAWSPVSTFTVRTGSSTPLTPTLTITNPTAVITVTSPSVTLSWELDDPEHNSKIALYSDNDNLGADGTRIIDGLPQDPSRRTGSYTWDVSTLAPGSYYIYGVATNSAGSNTRYAPGVFVIPTPNPRGMVSVTPITSPLETTEAGGSAQFSVVLGNSPKSDVSIGVSVTHPLEARLDKPQLLFTTATWKTPQTVTLTGLPDCLTDGDITYQLITAKSVSADPDYDGIKGADLTLINRNSTVGCPSNNPPLANAGPNQLVDAGSSVVLTGSGTDSDGAIASFAWLQTAGPTLALTSTTTSLSGFTAPLPTVDTVFTFQLTVTDNLGATGTASVSVTVKAAPNQPPTANAGVTQTLQSGSTVTLTGIGTDPDGTIAAFAWTQIAGPTVTLTGANAATASFIAPPVSANTVLGFQLTVTDNQGATGTSTVSITVIPNLPPVVSAGAAQTVNEKLPVTLTGTASDPDGSIARYAWAQTAGPTVTLTGASTATASFTAPSITVDTILTFTLTVTDNLGATASASVNITVKNVPSLPPIADAGGPYAAKAGEILTLNGGASYDPEGVALIYKWNFGDGSTGLGVAPTHAYAAPGTYTVSLIVNDGEQDSIPSTIGAVILPTVAGNVAAGILPGNPVIPPNKPQAMAILATNQTGVTLTSVTIEYTYSSGLLVTNLIAPTATTKTVNPLTRKIQLSWSNVANGQNVGAVFAAAALVAGSYTVSPSKVQYVLPDGTTQTVTANTATLSVSSTGNQVPSVTGGPAQTVKQGTLSALNGSAIDTDGAIIGYYWQQVSGPAVVLSNPLSRAPTFTAPAVTANTALGFVLFAIDNNGGLGTATTSVTVTP
ncbi:MAG: PKD domain-containing protein [Gammaproteobacteria bacterium]|nr:PKD domain-containing protein [Gammaproteobacteria bacterium]